MAQLQMTEAKVTRDFAAVLQKIGSGVRIVVDTNGCPMAIIRAADQEPMKLSQLIELAAKREEGGGHSIHLDEG